MIITLWGTRGSLACSGADFNDYGGNTSCVEVRAPDNSLLILDAGTGIHKLGLQLEKEKNLQRITILLTHLHMDHIQGLGFFAPLFDSSKEIHIYAPACSDEDLYNKLSQYLSPPLFPVLLRDFPCELHLHCLPPEEFTIGNLSIYSQRICHPGLTVGYRISSANASMAYLPDHELALGVKEFPLAPEWTSGYDLAHKVDLLLHDAQYTLENYKKYIGWGHSAIEQVIAYAAMAQVKTLVTFHHDPCRKDAELNKIFTTLIQSSTEKFKILPGKEGSIFRLP